MPVFDPQVFDPQVFDAGGESRTASDTTTVSDSLTRAAIVHSRTATDTTSVSESVGGTYGKSRTATDTTSVSDSVGFVEGIPRIRQFASNHSTSGYNVTMPGAINAGNELLALIGSRGGTGAQLGSPWTFGPDGFATAFNSDRCAINYRVAGSGESTTLAVGGDTAACWIELDQEVVLDAHAEATDPQNGTAGQATVSVTVADKSIVFAIITEGSDGGWGNQTFTPPDGWVELSDRWITTDHPSVWVGYRVMAVGGTVTADPTCTATGFWTAQIISFVAKAVTRTLTDTTTLSETATWPVVHNRTMTDTTSLTENVGKGVIPRILVDTVITSDSVHASGTGAGFRTATDTTSLSESVSRGAMVFHRVCVDTVKAIDSLRYQSIPPVASFTASIVSGEEPLRVQFVDTSLYNPISWQWDFGDGTFSLEQNPYHIYAAGTYTVTLIVTNETGQDTSTQTDLITATPLSPGVDTPRPPVDVSLIIDGDEYFQYTRYADATFTSAVNGAIGRCQFAVLDRGHDLSFLTGKTIDLYIGGIHYWSGFVEIVHRNYSFDVDDTTDAETVERWFIIEGFDVNALLTGRVAWNIAHPTFNLRPPQGESTSNPNLWREGGRSDTVVKYVLKNYTLLSFDGVTFNEVIDIGSPNPDTMDAHGGGITVYQFLQQVNGLLNGIFYLRPNRSFVFRDVEVATTPFIITDTPDGPYDVGPRDYSMMSDATKMVNDAMVWGTAKGVDYITFARVQSDASQAEHGRWQTGEFTGTLYKQTSVNHRANALVYGNRPTRHGAKDDRAYCEATVFRPLFQLGDVVRCEQRVYDGTQTLPFNTDEDFVAINLPVRTMEITFPAQNHPQFRMILSEELDEPWNTYEFAPFRLPPIRPPGPLPPLPPIEVPINHPPAPCGDGISCSNMTVLSQEIGGGEIGTVVPPYAESWNSAGDTPPRTVYLYPGAVYTVQINVYHNPSEWAIRVGAGPTFEMGGPGYLANWEDPIYGSRQFASATFVGGGVTSVGIEHITRTGFGGAGSSAFARFFYVSGSDPRFENLSQCDIPQLEDGWGTVVGGANCCEDVPPDCATDLLTEDNYSTDWFVISDEGTFTNSGHYIYASIPDNDGTVNFTSELAIRGFFDIPRSLVEGGLVVNFTFGYDAASDDPGLNMVWDGRVQVQGSNSTRRRGKVSQDVGENPTSPYRLLTLQQLLTGEVKVPVTINPSTPYTFSQMISSTAGFSKLVETSDTVTLGAPTIGAGDPVTIQLDMQVLVSSQFGFPAGAGTVWMGAPVFMDLDGNILDLSPWQICIPADCVDSQVSQNGPVCEMAVQVGPTTFRVSNRIGGGAAEVWLGDTTVVPFQGFKQRPGQALDFTVQEPNFIELAQPIEAPGGAWVCYFAEGLV